MRWSDYLRFALGALKRIPLRSLFTVAGVTVGIAAMVLLVGFGVQSERTLTEHIAGAEQLKTITVLSGRGENPMRRRRGPQGAGDGAGAGARLDAEALETLRKIDGVVDAYPNVFFYLSLRIPGDDGYQAGCLGVGLSPGVTGEAVEEQLAEGEPLVEGERQLLITQQIAEDLSEDWRKLVGTEVEVAYLLKPPRKGEGSGAGSADDGERMFGRRVGRERYVVAGILSNRARLSTTQSTFDAVHPNTVVLPLPDAKRLYTLADNPQNFASQEREAVEEYMVASVIVDQATPERIQAVREAITEQGLHSFHIYDILQFIKGLFMVLNGFFIALGAVALFVATLQIANTMTMSVLERTREIGVMKAIGARDRDIRRLFLAEAGIIGGVGALLGVGIAIAVGKAVELGVRYYVKSFHDIEMNQPLFALPVWLFLGVLAFGIGVSLFAALIPAWRGARTEPAIALRRE